MQIQNPLKYLWRSSLQKYLKIKRLDFPRKKHHHRWRSEYSRIIKYFLQDGIQALYDLIKFSDLFLAKINLFKVNNRNTRKWCKTCSKLTIKRPERGHWRRYEGPQWHRSSVFEHISLLLLVFLLLTLNRSMSNGLWLPLFMCSRWVFISKVIWNKGWSIYDDKNQQYYEMEALLYEKMRRSMQIPDLW